MKINFERVRIAANQIGIVTVAGGIVHGIVGGGGPLSVFGLVGFGLMLVLIASMEDDK